MIPKGNLHAHGGRLATYITKGQDHEKAALIDMRGFAAEDLREAFCDIQAISESLTACKKPFFHAYVRLPADECLTRDQWLEVADQLERKLGFDDQARGVTLHFEDDGTTHMHVAWSRIDLDTMTAIDPGLYLRKMKEVCRQLEKEWGLQAVSSELPLDRLTGAAKQAEFDQDRRLGIDGTALRETIRDCYDRSDNGPSFAAALAEQDIVLAKGDRYSFVAIDSEGGLHALGKRTLGVKVQDIDAKLGMEFRVNLPTVDEARTEMDARRGVATESVQTTPSPNFDAGLNAVAALTPVAGMTRAAMKAELTALWSASDSGAAFVASAEAAGFILARGTRRDFVVIDGEGEPVNLVRLINGAKTAEVRAKMAGLDPGSLPTMDEAQALSESRRQPALEATVQVEATATPVPPGQVHAAASMVMEPPAPTFDRDVFNAAIEVAGRQAAPQAAVASAEARSAIDPAAARDECAETNEAEGIEAAPKANDTADRGVSGVFRLAEKLIVAPIAKGIEMLADMFAPTSPPEPGSVRPVAAPEPEFLPAQTPGATDVMSDEARRAAVARAIQTMQASLDQKPGADREAYESGYERERTR